MKTRYLYVGSNAFFIAKLKMAFNDVDIIVDKYPLSGIKYLNVHSNVPVVLFESAEESNKAFEFVQFFRENINREILFFVIADAKQNLSKNFSGFNDFFGRCADDVFYINMDINLVDHDIQKIRKRIHFLVDKGVQISRVQYGSHDEYRIPLWKRSFDIVFSLCCFLGELF